MNDRLEDLVKRLPRRIEPERDLWPEIESRLKPRRFRRAPKRALYSLAAALLIAAVTLGAWFALRPGAPVPGTAEPVAQTQSGPDPVAVISRNLATVNEAIGKITAAIGRDPDNPVLYRFLYDAYFQKNRLLFQRTKLILLRSDMS